MLTKCTYLISIVWMLNLSSAIAQATAGRTIDDHLLMRQANRNVNGATMENIEGTPYLTETFANGEIYLDKGKHVVPIRYNMYNDVIEYNQNNQTYVLDPNDNIKKVQFNDYIFIVEKYESKGKAKHGYFTLLDSGKVTLLSKKTVIFKERQDVRALESGPTPAKYIRGSDAFFYKIGEGELIKVDNIKKMIANLPERQAELSQFAKQEKISAKKEEDLRKLVQYYNSL